MPFYCGKRSASICVVLGSKHSSTYSSEYASELSSLRPCICQQLLCLATKDYSDRLLAARDPTVKACELYQNFLPFALLP
jgi:hypothetical protein